MRLPVDDIPRRIAASVVFNRSEYLRMLSLPSGAMQRGSSPPKHRSGVSSVPFLEELKSKLGVKSIVNHL